MSGTSLYWSATWGAGDRGSEGEGELSKRGVKERWVAEREGSELEGKITNCTLAWHPMIHKPKDRPHPAMGRRFLLSGRERKDACDFRGCSRCYCR